MAPELFEDGAGDSSYQQTFYSVHISNSGRGNEMSFHSEARLVITKNMKLIACTMCGQQD